MSRQPRAYPSRRSERHRRRRAVTEEPFDAIEAADGVVVPMGEKRRAPWVGILLSALSGLLLLGLGLAVENLIVDLYAVAPWLGWVALALAVLAVAGLPRHRRPRGRRDLARAEDRAPARGRHRRACRQGPQGRQGIVSDLLALYGGRAARGSRERPAERPDRRDHRRGRPPRHRRARASGPSRRPGQARDRGRREAGLPCHGSEPARHRRRRLRDLRRGAPPADALRGSMADGPACSASCGSPRRPSTISR